MAWRRVLLVPLVAVFVQGCATPVIDREWLPDTARPAPPSKPTGALLAAQWRAMLAADDTGHISPGSHLRALNQRGVLLQKSAARKELENAGISPGQWVPIGPATIAGRKWTLAVYPVNANRIWAGADGGGLWASVDGGANWTAVNDSFPSLDISSIAIDPTNPNVMYVGTGPGYLEHHPSNDGFHGAGIYKSINGGSTWTRLASTDPAADAGWSYVNRIAVSPANGNIVLAATGATFQSSGSGLYRSADGGVSWTPLANSAHTSDVKFDPNNANNAIRGRFDGSVSYSSDAGINWNA